MLSPAELAPPPIAGGARPIALLLDFDGTLVELAARPDAVVVDDALIELLTMLAVRLEGRLAIVSGRSLAQLDGLLGPIAGTLAIAGSHGVEHRWAGATPPAPGELFGSIRDVLRDFASTRPGVIVENKSHGVGMHYRLAPEHGAAAEALVRALGAAFCLAVQPGKMMIELRTGGSDKGDAVRALMARPEMAGASPLFVGDDVTDEAGFAAAVALGGGGVLVGLSRPTAARYRLADVTATRSWLTAMAEGDL